MTEEIVTGMFEIHVFVAPLDPPPEIADAFAAACRAAPAPMKALLLELDYVDKGFVGVLQTSRYVEGDVAAARAAANADADALRAAGFDVIRRKVEAVAADAGVPQDAADAALSPPDRYFEFHVLIDGRDGPLSEDDMVALRGLSAEMSARLGRPVPLSYNSLRPSQRFLNLRARGCGLDEALAPVRDLERALAQRETLRVKKVIAEYICSDDNRAVDDGWTEPLPVAPRQSEIAS